MGKYTYLSNDSCYSVFPEDGVEISFVDDNFLNRNHKNPDPLEELSHGSHASGTVQFESSTMPSFSLEAQVDYSNPGTYCLILGLSTLYSIHLLSCSLSCLHLCSVISCCIRLFLLNSPSMTALNHSWMILLIVKSFFVPKQTLVSCEF